MSNRIHMFPRALIQPVLQQGFVEGLAEGIAGVDRLLESLASGPRTALTPAVNVFEVDDTYVVEAELPGFQPDDISVDVEGETLTLAGHRAHNASEGATVRRSERATGSFERTLTLPGAVEVESISAALINGVLIITLPKAASARARRVPVLPTHVDSDTDRA